MTAMAETSTSCAEDQARAPQEPEDIAQLRADKASLHDRLLRALAEVENTGRRGERSVADACQFAISDFARDLLAVVDALQRALAAAKAHPRDAATAALIDGVEATRHVLMAVLANHGIQPIEALGKPFDPKFHEAVQEVDDDSGEPGTVIEVIEDGYTINGRLLSPARVVVARRASGTPSARAGQGGSSSS
jgi:molecular chaperone GrpE